MTSYEEVSDDDDDDDVNDCNNIDMPYSKYVSSFLSQGTPTICQLDDDGTVGDTIADTLGGDTSTLGDTTYNKYDPRGSGVTSVWNPVASVQLSSCDDFTKYDLEESERTGSDVLGLSGRDGDPPSSVDPDDVEESNGMGEALLKWVNDTDSNKGAENASGSTEEMTDEALSDLDEDFEPCEEHYRVPKASGDGSEKKQSERSQQRQLDPDYEPEQQMVVRKRNQEPEETKLSFTSSRSLSFKGVRPSDPEHMTTEELVDSINNALTIRAPQTSNSSPSNSKTNTSKPNKYNGYQHHFITVQEDHRFLMLYTFLKRNIHNKVILFFSTTKSTEYYTKLLQRLKFDARCIHSGQRKEKYLSEFFDFSKNSTSGILCLPDSEGEELAIPPNVAWIVQYEPPANPSEYIFRVGRISSESSLAVGRALLFLTPHQFGFLQYYKAAQVKFYEYEIPKLSNVQKQYVKLLRKDDRLRAFGVAAYHGYLISYASHEFRDVYDIHEVDQSRVALSFGFTEPPLDEESGDEEETDNKRTLRKGGSRWKPNKPRGDSWLKGEKSWRYADRHSSAMRVGSVKTDL